MESKWTNKWPKEEGIYWLYSYRYGKISCGTSCKPELIQMKVYKVFNGFMYMGEGQFIYESEVEEPYFQKVIIPKLPKI